MAWINCQKKNLLASAPQNAGRVRRVLHPPSFTRKMAEDGLSQQFWRQAEHFSFRGKNLIREKLEEKLRRKGKPKDKKIRKIKMEQNWQPIPVGGADFDEIWDDSELIKAYSKSIEYYKVRFETSFFSDRWRKDQFIYNNKYKLCRRCMTPTARAPLLRVQPRKNTKKRRWTTAPRKRR